MQLLAQARKRRRFTFPLTNALLAKFEAQAHYEEIAADPM